MYMMYFVLKNNRKLGPFSESQLRELVTAGLISNGDRAWKVETSEDCTVDQMLPTSPLVDDRELEIDFSPEPFSFEPSIHSVDNAAIASSNAVRLLDDSVVGPDVPHSRSTPALVERLSFHDVGRQIDCDALTSMDAILPLRVATNYQERPVGKLSDDDNDASADSTAKQSVTLSGTTGEVTSATTEDDYPEINHTEIEFAQEEVAVVLTPVALSLTHPDVSTTLHPPLSDTDVRDAKECEIDSLGTVEFPHTIMPPVETEEVLDLTAHSSPSILLDDTSLAHGGIVDDNSFPTETISALEAILNPPKQSSEVDLLSDNEDSLVYTEFPQQSLSVGPDSSETLAVGDFGSLHPEVDSSLLPEMLVGGDSKAVTTSDSYSVDSGRTSDLEASQQSVVTQTTRQAEGEVIEDVCSRIEARLAERRIRSNNTCVVPTGGILVFSGLLYAMPIVNLAIYGYAIQMASAGTFRITPTIIPYCIEAVSALLFHAYGVVVAHKVLMGDQQGKSWVHRHLELRRFILPIIWMTLFITSGPIPLALPGFPVSESLASTVNLTPFQLRIFYMIFLEQLFCSVWDIYFRRSQRVQETYSTP